MIKMFRLLRLLVRGWNLIRYGTGISILLMVSILACDYYITVNACNRIFRSSEVIPEKRTVLVLGTAYRFGKYVNPYFKYRLDAAVKLYKADKVRHFILSGDNHCVGYNEPQDMKNYLLNAGIPDSLITLDYAGFRTFDSVVRLKKIFGQSKVTIVSQAFHLRRALFLADQFGIDAIGFAARDVHGYVSGYMEERELLARLKAVLDVYVLGTRPRFLGPKVSVE